MTQDHEYMDTGALTDDAVPAPSGWRKKAVESPPPPSDVETTSDLPVTLPQGAYAVPVGDAKE